MNISLADIFFTAVTLFLRIIAVSLTGPVALIPYMNKIKLAGLFLFVASSVFAQPNRWQQKVKYKMDVDMNVVTNQFTGKQKLEYWNNSPDTHTSRSQHALA